MQLILATLIIKSTINHTQGTIWCTVISRFNNVNHSIVSVGKRGVTVKVAHFTH